MILGQMGPNMNMNMEDFEKELEEANKAIEEYISSLPPEEQAVFNQSVADMTQMFESMSDEDFERFLGEMFADDPMMMMEENPFDAGQPTAQEPVAETVVLSEQDKKKTETAIAVLQDIILQSNLFTVLVNSSSDLPNRINIWATKGNISNWQTGADWENFKGELDKFVQKLHKVQEQDINTKKYKYLLEFIADEGLYNNLIQLQTELKALVPKIDIPEFNVQKVTKQSKQTIQTILSKYAECFYLLGVPKALDTLFEKYAPEEEKIRAAEEAATKKATEASKVKRSPAAATEAGTEGDMYGDYGYDSYYPDYYSGGYDNYGYSPYDNYGGGYPSYDNYSSNSGFGGDSGSSSGGGNSGSGNTGTKGGNALGKEKEETEEKEKKEKKEKSEFIPSPAIERSLGDIKSNFEDIKTAMVNDEGQKTKLANLAEYITNNDEPVDEGLALYTLPMLYKKIANIDSALTTINKKTKLDQDDLKIYQKEVEKIFDDNKKDLETLVRAIDGFEVKTAEQITLERAAPSTIVNIADYPVKYWAYFGGDDSLLATDEDKALLEKIPSRKSLFDIRNKINTLLKDKQEFLKKKAKVETPKAESKMKTLSLDL